MKGWLEALGFLLAAVLVHLAVFAMLPELDLAEAPAKTQQPSIASGADYGALVARWTTAPSEITPVLQQTAPLPSSALQVLHRQDQSLTQPKPPQLISPEDVRAAPALARNPPQSSVGPGQDLRPAIAARLDRNPAFLAPLRVAPGAGDGLPSIRTRAVAPASSIDVPLIQVPRLRTPSTSTGASAAAHRVDPSPRTFAPRLPVLHATGQPPNIVTSIAARPTRKTTDTN